jgi:hypothetical protein
MSRLAAMKRYRALLLISALLAPGPAPAQSPFQSAPGPPPVVKPAPRPAPRQQPQEEYSPSVAPAPAPAPAAAPAPAPPPPPSLAGMWHFQSNCPLDTGADLSVTAAGPEQYRIAGTTGILPVAVVGWVSGKLVHMEATALINHVVWEGNLDSPTTMSGKITQTLLGNTCQWVGQKK